MRKWLIVLAVLATLAVAGGAAALLTHHSTSGPSTGQHAPGDADSGLHGPRPDGVDAATAAQLALTAMFSWQPVSDASTGAGLVRAKPYLTGQLLDAANGTVAPQVRPLPEWAAWRESKDVIEATVTNFKLSPIEGGECVVTATVTQNVRHLDNSTTRYKKLDVSAAMRKTDAGWRMASWRLQS
ncbi:hypothetical protein ACWELJ_32635 [Nocardia sp. NPDC004582]